MPGLRRYLLELLATFFLTLTVLGAAAQDVLLGALAIGAMVGVLVRVGGHANPVLTLASVVARRLPAGELLPFWAAQLVGALLGAALARWLVTAPAASPLQGVSVVGLLVAEALFAFALCFVVLDGERGDNLTRWSANGWSAGAAGLTVVGASALLDPVAGSAFNPAAAFGQVVAGLTGWSTIWVYLVACPVGAAVAGLASLAADQTRSRSG